MEAKGLQLSVIDLRLPTLITGKSYADLGYPDLKTMLQHALNGSDLTSGRFGGQETSY